MGSHYIGGIGGNVGLLRGGGVDPRGLWCRMPRVPQRPCNLTYPAARLTQQSDWHRGEGMSETQQQMAGTRGLVMGVANARSIAWGIATAAGETRPEFAFTFLGAG